MGGRRESLFQSAIVAGAMQEQPIQDAFLGDPWGRLIDPFGHRGQIATHKEELTPEQTGPRAAKVFSQSA